MNICDAYHADKNFLGEIGVCWGTKEREACSCQGDKTKCDFYPKTDVRPITTSVAHYTLDLRSGTIRAKPIITNYDIFISKPPKELAAYIRVFFPEICPPIKCPGEDYCYKCWLDWLESPADEEG